MLSKRVLPTHNCSSDSEGESHDESGSFDTDRNTTHLTSFCSALVDYANYSRMSMASKLNVTRLRDVWSFNEEFTGAAALVATLPSPPSDCVILAFHSSGRYLATGEVRKNGVTKENNRGESQSFITKL